LNLLLQHYWALIIPTDSPLSCTSKDKMQD